ncbi:MAG TPA: flagellar basal body P-ring protein FlgI [Phycisphaerae bacterium]|nr:flagellar basal body P-ring protein FlgI [Phycisphaerae bacterium]
MVRRTLGVRASATLCLAVVALAAASPSCLHEREPREPRTPRDIEEPGYLKDTVGAVARFAGREPVAVQGFGFVTGLDGTGTKVVPPGVRQQILAMMRRNKVGHAEEILADPDTAVVTVSGWLTPGIAKGERFGLAVQAIPRTDTTSLEGGFLLECDLTRVRLARGVESRSEPLALGRGSIFVSPFGSAGRPQDAGDPRLGRVLAGGKALKARHFRLALLTPSVRTADQIVRLVNARFPGAASGTEDPGRIDLAVPRRFREDKTHFLDLVGAIYMRETPAARDNRVALLLETLEAGEDMDRVALCLEAFGPTVAPHLYGLGAHSSGAVRFYVGRTLARLQDARAVHILERIATDDTSPHQEQAVAALGELRSGIGLGVLGRTLNAASARVRVAAWQQMERLSPPTFVARRFADKFTLSIVATRAEPFIYVARTLKPQIALFGDVTIRPPILAETRRVTATALENEDTLKLISRRRATDVRVEAALDVRDLIEKVASPFGVTDTQPKVQGLDLGYSDVVGLLHEMSRKGALSGRIVLQPLEYRIAGDRPTARPISTTGEEP